MNLSFRSAFLVATGALFVCLVSAQVSPEQQRISARVLDKIQTIDLYNQILPVLMTPAQLKDILPALEKYRSEHNKVVIKEHNLLKDLEKDLDVAIADIKKSDNVPDQAIMTKYLNYLQAFSIVRQTMFAEARNEVISLLKKNLNAGQITAAANSLSPRSLGGETDPKKFTEDQKLTYWVEIVLFDPLSYQIMVDLAKKK